MRGLLRHPERLGDPTPRQTRPHGLGDVVRFEPVKATTQLGDILNFGTKPYDATALLTQQRAVSVNRF
jgi:hypothetical protein